MTNKRMIEEIKKRQAVLAKESDRLRDLRHEISSLEEVCERASDALNEAIYALMELV